MKELKIWQFMHTHLAQQKPVVFLCVVHSIGSSPGRQGFKMAVAANELCGSIGGGIMEHKFVELAKEILKNNVGETIVKQQQHSKNVSVNQSGMICSGEQTVAVYPLKQKDLTVIEKIVDALKKNEVVRFQFSAEGFLLNVKSNSNTFKAFIKSKDAEWSYAESIKFSHHIHIVGAGHVSLAFSKLMRDLNFYITVYDDREGLNTMQQNVYAHKKLLVNYESINELIADENDFVVIMTFGYRTDGIVLRKLMHKNFCYLGLLGSKAKVEKMLQELRAESVDETLIKKIHAPAGIPINSQTPEEIAVSIAAEIIKYSK